MNNDKSYKKGSIVEAIAEEMKLQIIYSFLKDQIDYAGGRFDNQHILSVDLIVSTIVDTHLTDDFVRDCEQIVREHRQRKED